VSGYPRAAAVHYYHRRYFSRSLMASHV